MGKEMKLWSNNKRIIAAATDLNNDMHEHQNEEENGFKWLWTRWTWLSVPDRLQVGVLWQTDWSTGSSNGSNGSRKRKYPVSGSCVEENLFSISDSLEAMGRRQRRKQPLEVCRTLSLNRHTQIHSAAILLGTRRCWVRGHRAFQQLGPFSQITWECLRCYQMINSSQDFCCSVPLCPGKTPRCPSLFPDVLSVVHRDWL